MLDENGNRMQVGDEQFTVREDGTITKDGQTIARLGIAYAANVQSLAKEGNGLFRAEGELPRAEAYTIRQQYIERSNVDLSRAMTDMLSAYRAFEANQKFYKRTTKAWTKQPTKLAA